MLQMSPNDGSHLSCHASRLVIWALRRRISLGAGRQQSPFPGSRRFCRCRPLGHLLDHFRRLRGQKASWTIQEYCLVNMHHVFGKRSCCCTMLHSWIESPPNLKLNRFADGTFGFATARWSGSSNHGFSSFAAESGWCHFCTCPIPTLG